MSSAAIEQPNQDLDQERCVQMLTLGKGIAKNVAAGYPIKLSLDAITDEPDLAKKIYPALSAADMEATVLAMYSKEDAASAYALIALECRDGILSRATLNNVKASTGPTEQFFAWKVDNVVWGIAAHPEHGVYLLINNASKHVVSADFHDFAFALANGKILAPCCGYERGSLGFATTLIEPISVPSGGAKAYSLAQNAQQVIQRGSYMRMNQQIISIAFKDTALCQLKTRQEFDDATADGIMPSYCKMN
ncbi:hypothetical protein CJD38_07100 [Stenotrophobium rhamnosiphilum]|uniref:Uncharacterized protein n=1 Tax=Stenotrophobium rhamnosiphilum TaxID=2029166 RepID=A0A2T5MIP3_9GAMM|nr:hypothetical protein CJD38_07100 [Stenotrophobium rhamnosiphilum]